MGLQKNCIGILLIDTFVVNLQHVKTIKHTSSMEQNEILERIKYLIRNLGYRQNEFADKIGVNPSNLSKYINGHLPIGDSMINRIVVNIGVSKEWLVNGTDLPFAKGTPMPPQISVPSSLVKPEPLQGTPVYDVDVTAGTMPRAQMFADDRIVGSVNMPDLISPQSRIVRVSGDSMSPVIRSGDYLAVRELTNTRQIYWGQIYVVMLDDYRMVKYVRRHHDPEQVILHSENPAYDDMEVPRSDIHELMFVQTILHIDTRM